MIQTAGRRSRSRRSPAGRRSITCDVYPTDGRVPPYATYYDSEENPDIDYTDRSWDQLSFKQQIDYYYRAEQYAYLLGRGSPHYRSQSPDVHSYGGHWDLCSQKAYRDSWCMRACSNLSRAYEPVYKRVRFWQQYNQPGKSPSEDNSTNLSPQRTGPAPGSISPCSLLNHLLEEDRNRKMRPRSLSVDHLKNKSLERKSTNLTPQRTNLVPKINLEKVPLEDNSMNQAMAWGYSSLDKVFASSRCNMQTNGKTDKNSHDEHIKTQIDKINKLEAEIQQKQKDVRKDFDLMKKSFWDALSAAEEVVAKTASPEETATIRFSSHPNPLRHPIFQSSDLPSSAPDHPDPRSRTVRWKSTPLHSASSQEVHIQVSENMGLMVAALSPSSLKWSPRGRHAVGGQNDQKAPNSPGKHGQKIMGAAMGA